MSRHETIETLVRESLSPLHLEVIDESHMHNVPEGSESHFKLVVVSDRFEGTGLVQRHRMINKLLAGELERGLHALALHTMTPEEWFAKGGEVPASPECMGGSERQ